MNRFCSAAIVTPVTCAPKCSAACSESDPQPQPTSSSRHPGLQPELAADQVELVALRVGHGVRRVGARPVAARVRHRRVEQQPVEVVREVVVVRDRAPVAQRGVPPPPQLRLRRGRGGPTSEHAEPGGGADRADESGRRGPSAEAALARDRERVREGAGEVAGHVELPGDVGLGRAELARVPEHPADGVGGAEHDHGGVGGAGLRAVPGPQSYRQVAADERAQRLREPRRHPGRGAAGRVRVGRGHACSSGRSRTSWWTSRYPDANPARAYSR